jgi:hypothetical protein
MLPSFTAEESETYHAATPKEINNSSPKSHPYLSEFNKSSNLIIAIYFQIGSDQTSSMF